MATGLGTSSQYITLMPSEYHPLAQIICIIVVLKVLKVSCQNLEWSRLSDVINRGKIRKIKLKKANFFNLILRVEDATLSKIRDHNLERQSF